MNSDLAAPICAALVSAGVTSLAVFSISRYEAWTRRHSIHFVGFAAGVLIVLPLIHVIPEAIGVRTGAVFFVPAGFFALCASHLVVERFAGGEGESARRRETSILLLVGVGFHSLLDGVIYAVTFSFDTLLGVLSAVGLDLHEFPEGVLTFVLIVRGGFGRRRAMVYALLAAGATTPAGTLLTYPFLRQVTPEVLGALLALAGGALLYVGAAHLLPELEQERRGAAYLALAVGALFAAATGAFGD